MELVIYPDNQLRIKSIRVNEITTTVKNTLCNILEKMYENNGIGLSAPQVGILQRMFVIDVKNGNDPLFFVNPEIMDVSEETSTMKEGCLSLPGAFGDVVRPNRVKIQFLNYSGNQCEATYTGLLATAIQHETDHLDGIMHIDRMQSYYRRRALQCVWESRISLIRG